MHRENRFEMFRSIDPNTPACFVTTRSDMELTEFGSQLTADGFAVVWLDGGAMPERVKLMEEFDRAFGITADFGRWGKNWDALTDVFWSACLDFDRPNLVILKHADVLLRDAPTRDLHIAYSVFRDIRDEHNETRDYPEFRVAFHVVVQSSEQPDVILSTIRESGPTAVMLDI